MNDRKDLKVPILMLTLNRPGYMLKAITSLLNMKGITPYIIDDGSTDSASAGILDSLQNFDKEFHYNIYARPKIFRNKETRGIAHRMNQFIEMTAGHEVCGKIDSDSLCEPEWVRKMKPFLKYADAIQSKHHIIPATNQNGWEGFTENMVKGNGLLYHTFIGGSGILFRRDLVTHIPETKWALGGWREFQRQNQKLKFAFVPSVEIKLLDEHGYTDYPEYYKLTGRI